MADKAKAEYYEVWRELKRTCIGQLIFANPLGRKQKCNIPTPPPPKKKPTSYSHNMKLKRQHQYTACTAALCSVKGICQPTWVFWREKGATHTAVRSVLGKPCCPSLFSQHQSAKDCYKHSEILDVSASEHLTFQYWSTQGRGCTA